MATADFELKMTAEGTDEELLTIVNIMCRYAKGENGVYFSFSEAERNGVKINLEKASDELGSEEEFVYDPIAKEYVDRDTPVLKSNTVYSLNDTIREQLEKRGLPSDDEAIANLSVDEVYSLMAGVLGYAEDESEDEEDGFDDDEDFDDED